MTRTAGWFGSGAGSEVVVASLDATPGEVFDHLFLLVKRLVAVGLDVEVVLIGEGERLAQLEALARVTVVDRFRRRGPATLAWFLRQRILSHAIKVKRVQWWVRSRLDRPWIVHHPVAASLLRHTAGRPPILVACLPTASSSVGEVAPADLQELGAAGLWLTWTDDQAEALSAAGLGPSMVTGSLADPRPAPPPGFGSLPVVLLPTSPAWDEINHTAEIARHMAVRHPDLGVEWVVHGADDRWLARHDLGHLGLADVRCTDSGDVDLSTTALLVCTGYGAGGANLCWEASELGVPILGFDLPSGLGPSATSFGPFAIEAMTARLDVMVSGGELVAAARARAGRREAELVRLGRQIGELAAILRAGAQESQRRRRSSSGRSCS